ncbi:MAG: oxidoreductase [Ponticaulis sp.]|nr:oxidoreductase [Ponticaulis sp.]
MINPDQHRIPTGIEPHTPALDLLEGVDLSGKTAVVTGGHSGIGLETTRALAAKGARIIVPARNAKSAGEALASVPGEIQIASMDLSDLSTVKSFGNEMRDSLSALHILINNAGVMACPPGQTKSGWETQFGTNHLGHMALTLELLPLLRSALSSRVVCLSSTGHAVSDIHWEDPNFRDHDYDKWQAYGQSKTANALFAVGLDQREKANDLRAYAVHPGGIFTNLQRHLPEEEMVILGWKNEDGTIPPRVQKSFKTPAAGASTSVFAATSTALNHIGGVYCEDCDVADVAEPDTPRYHKVRPYAVDTEAADRLWSLSMELLGDA